MTTSGFCPNNASAPYVEFNEESSHHSLHAARPYEKEEIIAVFQAHSKHSQATYLTIQTGDDCHISLAPTFLQYVNHSCSPNTVFDTISMTFIALRAIAKGDELCFFYPSTEWQLAQAFNCHCGNSNCLGEIAGAAFLPQAIVNSYQLSEYILSKLAAAE